MAPYVKWALFPFNVNIILVLCKMVDNEGQRYATSLF
jgi:hypothetical protein